MQFVRQKLVTLVGIFLMVLMAGLLPAQQKSEPDENAFMNPGSLYVNRYVLNKTTLESAGVKLYQLSSENKKIGGPWAMGETGDFIMENAEMRVLVKGNNRPPSGPGLPGAGEIADVALPGQNWDNLGGLMQLITLPDGIKRVLYNTVRPIEADNPADPPALAAYGFCQDKKDLLVITLMRLNPKSAELILETRYINNGPFPLEFEARDGMHWGGLAPFVGDYGFTDYSIYSRLETHWACGRLDDFALALMNPLPDPMILAPTHANKSQFFHSKIQLEPKQQFVLKRLLVASDGDMAPFVKRSLELQGRSSGILQGQVQEEGTGKPVANAEVYVSRVVKGQKLRNSTPRHAITQTDSQGQYQIALPAGEYYTQTWTPGRLLAPMNTRSFYIRAGQTHFQKNRQLPVFQYHFEAVDAETGEALPAKLRIEPEDVHNQATPNFGPPWKADGARQTVYLKPGGNAVPLVPGKYRCVFSRGPEYDLVRMDLHLKEGQTAPIRAEIPHVLKTPDMVSMDINLPTSASPDSRVSAEDLVLAAAGEGVEWLFSGDLHQVTDLNQAIEAQGLKKWIRASGGARLSYRHPKLFGDFYLFPLPLETSQAELDALATPDSTPAEFFAAVRQRFPNTLITVINPLKPNASYLNFYEMETSLKEVKTAEGFSWDFDAITFFEGKDMVGAKRNWTNMEEMIWNGHFPMPLASSRSSMLYYEEPGYPRMYLMKRGTNDARALKDEEAVALLRNSRYFVTTAPIAEIFLDGKWPGRLEQPRNAKALFTMQVRAAPWVPVEQGTIMDRHKGAGFFQISPDKKEIQRYPYDENTEEPEEWTFYILDRQSNDVEYRDTYLHLEVTGMELSPVAPGLGRQTFEAFAFTPPVYIDGTGDGKLENFK